MNLKRFPKRLDSKTSSLRITVPENLDLALEGLIRKVLREQPRTDDIYSFAANYFETLLKIRDKAGPNYNVGQSCPFHNDEEAHEMFKLAGTFKKPEKNKNSDEVLTKKQLKRPKPKRTVKDEKIVKEKPVDLVKKSIENRMEMGKISLTGRKTETIDEKVEIESEFLTSDPIKELVEKELMMEGKGSRKQAAAAADVMESCKKDIKPEELKADDKPVIKNIISQEKPTESNVEGSTETMHPEDEVEAVNITTESQHPTEQAQTEESKTKEMAIKDAEMPKVEKVQIDEETEVTVENIEHSVGNDSSVTNPPDDRMSEDKIEETVKKEKYEETVSKVQTVDEGTSQGDGEAEHKETLTESESANKEEKQLKRTENDKVKLEIENRDVENGTNEQEKELEGGEQTQKAESPKLDDAKLVENAEIKEEPSLTPETAQTETTSDADGRDTSTIEQKLKEEPKSVENQTEEPLIDSQEAEKKDVAENQKQDDKKIKQNDLHGVVEKVESERGEEITNQELCTVVDVKNIPKEDTKDENENKDEKTIQESTVIDVKSIPKEDISDEKEIEKDGKIIQESTVDVKNKPKSSEDEKQIENIENKLQEEKETNQDVLEDVKSIQTDIRDGKETKKDEKTDQELCTVVDVKNIPKEDTKDEKTIQESSVIDVKSIPKGSEDEKLLEKIENKIQEEKKTDQDVLDLKSIQTDTIDEKEIKKEEKTTQETTMIDVESTPKEDTKEKKQIETDEKTTQESTIIDIKSIPKDEKRDEKEINKSEIEHSDEKTTQASTIVDVKTPPKECAEDEKQIEMIENKIQEEKETNPDVLEDVLSVTEDDIKETPPDELCTVIDVKHMVKEKELEEQPTVEDVKSIPEEETIETDAIVQDLEGETIPDELCRVVDVLNIPKEEKIDEKPAIQEDITIKDTDVTTENEIKTKTVEIQPPDIIEPENPEAFQPSEEVHIKTIQTHYYDTLQVPETVTKEYIVHNIATPQIHTLDFANSLQPNPKKAIIENMNAPPPIGFIENINDLTREMESNSQITDSDDLLDITTPTSVYSLNLSEISWQTVNGLFLESERKYSALELEEIRYTKQSEDQTRHEVEEIIHKKMIPTGVSAVPVPPRDIEEINSEQANSESVKEKEKPESEGSRSDDSDLPFISVEVKTVIETQLLDEEEKYHEIRHPDVEVTVETTIDIQNDMELPQSEPDSIEEENKLSSGKIQDIDLKRSLEEYQSTSQDQPKESTSKEEGISVESTSTISSGATEIKRSDSGKRNFSSTRSLLSTQSLDLGKKNPLLKTRSLSTFRHGVTDFEVWNTIEKELEEAATKIQSKFRGYKTRKKLQRENAVQITTEESSPSPTPAELEVKEEEKGHKSTGEFHDSIILSEHPR